MIYIILILFLLFCLGVSYPLIYHKWLIKKDITKLRELVGMGRYHTAEKLANKMLKVNNKNIEVLYEQAKIQQAQKQWYLALYSLEEIIKINAYSESADNMNEPLNETLVRNKKIQIYQILKKDNAITEECEKILALNPDNMMASFFIGKRLFGLKNYKQAKEYLQVTDDEDFEKYREVLGMLVDIHVAEKKYTEAQNILNKLFKVLDKPVCRVYHQKATVLFYLKEYKNSLEVTYEIDKVYKWPLDLKLIEAISLYESYVQQASNSSEEPSKGISNKLQWENTEKGLIKKFEPLLSKHIDEEKSLVNHARYVYSVLLIKSGNWDLAIIQMKFIERVDAHYSNNLARLAVYEKVKHDSVLSRFFQYRFNLRSQEKSLKLGALIGKVVLDSDKWVCDSVVVRDCKHPLDPMMHLFHFKQGQKKANLHVVFSLAQNLSSDHLISLLERVNLVQGEVNDLHVFSLFTLKSVVTEIKGFDDIKLYEGKDLLKNLQSFSDQIDIFMTNT